MSADDFIADCFQRDEGCRHAVNTAGVNLDVCSQCVRDAYEAQPSLTPADLIALRDEWRWLADAENTLTERTGTQGSQLYFSNGQAWAYRKCADQLDALITRLSSETEKEKNL